MFPRESFRSNLCFQAFPGIGVLLSAVKDVSSGQDKLIDILNHIERFFHRLQIYTSITPTAAMTDVIVEIMVEVLTILALARKEVKCGRLKKYIKKLTGNTDIEDSLERLDKLTQEEARMASAELLKVTHSVDDRVRGVEGKVEDVRDVHDVGNGNKVQGVDDRVQGIGIDRFLLYTHGYIARMLVTMQALGYFIHLLRFDERDFQLVVSNRAFLLLHPALQNVRPVTCIDDRLAWHLDYMLRDVGTVVPQRLWSPAAIPDAQRYGTVPLNMPIFLVQSDRTRLGLPLNQAASGDCSALLNARLPAPVGQCHTTFIRIMWPGFNEWSS
ncbi:hypothetical protein F5888DRAFT_1636100 [Russula emetica]|nr:hypothetical protein F5888DRAFT_1636100 [Russula emetica]